MFVFAYIFLLEPFFLKRLTTTSLLSKLIVV